MLSVLPLSLPWSFYLAQVAHLTLATQATPRTAHILDKTRRAKLLVYC